MDPFQALMEVIQEATEAIVQQYVMVLLQGQLLQVMLIVNVALFAAFAAGYYFCMTLHNE